MSVNEKQQKIIKMSLVTLLTLCIFSASMTLLVISATTSYANSPEASAENIADASSCHLTGDIIST